MSRSIKIVCFIAPIILLLSVGLCLILANTQGSTSALKMKTLNLMLGQECQLKNLINVDKYEIYVDDNNILFLDNNSLYAKQCGETKVNILVNGSKETLDVKVYAEKVEFSQNLIELYVNGEGCANLSLYVDNNVYNGNLKYEFDSNIIDYNGNVITAKGVGETVIKTKVLGLNDFIECQCKVIVKQYGFVTSVDETKIVMVENQQRVFDAIMYNNGEKVKTNLYYDESLNCAIDYDLWCRAVKYLKFYNIQEVLVRYRVEGQGIATKRRDERIRNTIRIQQKILDALTSDKKIQEKLAKTLYSNEKIDKNFMEQIFSVKNSIQYNKKYKVITILGLEIKVLCKVYKREEG